MHTSVDVAASAFLLGIAAILALAVARLARRRTHARAEADGGSALLGVGIMNGFYVVLDPVARALTTLGITANAITFASLVLSLAAGVGAATGHFGIAALVATVAGAGDALDGLVARASGTASDGGEVFDAAVDRYSEFFLFGGLAIHFRGDLRLLVLTLAALTASMMVSYASAKAEALGVSAPRGAMRRAERAVYLVLGLVLAPFTPWAIVLALALIALVGNVSAVRRFVAIARPKRNGTLLKHQISSLIATVVDFGAMTALVELGITSAVPATVLGASVGAVTNFSLGRRWTFVATHEPAGGQALRYAVVSATSALLNALGEHIAHDTLGIQYLLARAVVAVLVSLAWNYPLQRLFVFRVAHR
jgi:CDP-diacylglycerol--glycerol-3-phosphate 3-phosphatidyltransferase